MLKFLQARYLKKPTTTIAHQDPDVAAARHYSQHLGPPPLLGSKADSIKPLSQMEIHCDERTRIFAKPSLSAAARRAGAQVQWLQVTKDLVSVLVGIVTVLQFLWPIAQWLWHTITA